MYEDLRERIQQKLASWKSKIISSAWRIILAQLVFNMLSFHAVHFGLPLTVTLAHLD